MVLRLCGWRIFMQEQMEIFNIFNPLTLKLLFPIQKPFLKNFSVENTTSERATSP